MKKSLWQIFSTYTIPTTSDYLQVNFNSDDEFKEVNYKDSDIYKMYKMYLDNSDRMQYRLFNSWKLYCFFFFIQKKRLKQFQSL